MFFFLALNEDNRGQEYSDRINNVTDFIDLIGKLSIIEVVQIHPVGNLSSKNSKSEVCKAASKICNEVNGTNLFNRKNNNEFLFARIILHRLSFLT